MSYIINNTNPFVSIKLTETGREKLALGQLNFSYWGVGDSEINYDREKLVSPTDVTLSATSRVMKPMDRQPNIKYFVTHNTNLSGYQTMTSENINVVKAVVNNQAEERGFFTHIGSAYTTDVITSGLTYYNQPVVNSTLTGGTILSLSSTTNINIGDYLLLKVGNTTTGNVSLTETDRAIPNLWFKVQDKTSNTVTLDRNLPNYSAQSVSSQVIIYQGGEIYDTISTGTTTAYWDTGTLSFNANNNVTCHDVPVWNMNNVWSENPAGITGSTYEDYTKFGSYSYLGFKNPYSEYATSDSANSTSTTCSTAGSSVLDEINKAISIIHYTNNSISNLYGEFLYIDTTNGKTVEIFIPELMYHRRNYGTSSGTSMGMKFIASGNTQVVGTSNIQYVDLIEDATMIPTSATPLVVGRVYPQLKIIVFSDDEIVSALSYKSNRNWTLPELSATLSSPSGGTSTGVLNVNETMYLTYSLENEGTTLGLNSSFPCQKYIKITNTTSSAKDVSFKISETDLLPYMRKIESGYDGLGFHAHKFKLVYQIVADSEIRPTSNAWKTYDFTTTAITGVLGETIDPKLLENQIPTTNGFILDLIKNSGATTFDVTTLVNMPLNTQPENLQFGDERFFYGNINSYIGATIYKTMFDINVNNSLFNTTSNPTRSKDLTTLPADIKISEVGIFDSNKNLVCIGKTSTPVTLSPGTNITLELSIDF